MKRSEFSLTPTFCDRAKGNGKSQKLWDRQVPGLCLLITPAGFKSFYYVGTRDKKQTWVNLGQYCKPKKGDELEVMSLDAARYEAQRLRKLFREGKDIRSIVRKERSPKSIQDLYEKFVLDLEYTSRTKKAKADFTSWMTRHILPAIGTRLVNDIKLEQVKDLYRTICEKGTEEKTLVPTAINCVRTLGRLLNFAQTIEWRGPGPNPCEVIKGIE